MVLRHMTAMMLIVMSIERWMSLVFPYTVKQSCVSKYPRFITIVSFVVAATYLLPFIGIWGKALKGEANTTDHHNSWNSLSDYTDSFDALVFVETLILHYIAPLILLFFNIALVIAYRRFVSNRPKTSNNGDNQNRITLVVLGVASLYLVLTLPVLFIQTLGFKDPDYKISGVYESTFKFFIDLGDLFAQIYAATDFFVYILVSKRYYLIFTSMVTLPRSA